MVLEAMADLSEMVAEAIAKPENETFRTGGATAGEWFARRVKNQRVKNRKVNVEFWRVVSNIHLEDVLGPRDVEGKPRDGAQSVGLLRRSNCPDTRLHRPGSFSVHVVMPDQSYFVR